MSHRMILRAVLAALVLAGTADAATSAATRAAEKQRLFHEAPYTLAGTVAAKPANGQLLVTPYGAKATAALQLGPAAPVYQGQATITDAGLLPGVNVRLHYRPRAGLAPQALAVEVLTPAQAQLERQRPQQLVAAAGTPPGAPVALGQTKPVTPQAKKATEAEASGSQAGRVIRVASGYVYLNPYQQAAGNARLTIASSTPVYSGNQQLATTALQPGQDVRVFYREHGRQPPSVIAIELLDKPTARRLELQEKNLPNPKRR